MTNAAHPGGSQVDRMAEAGRQLSAWKALTADVPAATPPSTGAVPLTVGIATYEDFDGAWFTLASSLLHHPELAGQVELLIVDNHPTSPASADLAAFVSALPGGRYVPFRAFRGTSVRDLIFREARGEVVCCLDSHVLVRPGGFAALVEYFADRGESKDLVQGPLLGGDLTTVCGTHYEPVWSHGYFGVWGNNGRGDDPHGSPYDLDFMGLGLFACRRDAWVGFHPGFRGFGGEEAYLHERVRRSGGRTVGLPALGWAHRFVRPAGIPYPNLYLERVRNYELGWAEMGWDLSSGRDHWREMGVPEEVFEIAARAPDHPAAGVDGVLVLAPRPDPARWAGIVAEAAQIDCDWRLERFSVDDAADPKALQAARDEARHRGWQSVLVVDERAKLAEADAALRHAVATFSATGADHVEVDVHPAGSAAIWKVSVS